MKTKLSVAIIGIAITASCCLSAHAQDLKAMLLKPANGWVIEWSNPDTRNSGVTEAMFVDHGAGVVAKLHITETGAYTGGPLSCEHNVNITADTIRFDGCRERNIVLSFDAGDTVYPLKSKSRSETGYIFKAKVK